MTVKIRPQTPTWPEGKELRAKRNHPVPDQCPPPEDPKTRQPFFGGGNSSVPQVRTGADSLLFFARKESARCALLQMHSRRMLFFLFAEVTSLASYLVSIVLLPTYFDWQFMETWRPGALSACFSRSRDELGDSGW